MYKFNYSPVFWHIRLENDNTLCFLSTVIDQASVTLMLLCLRSTTEVSVMTSHGSFVTFIQCLRRL